MIALHFVQFGKTRKFSVYELSVLLIRRMKTYLWPGWAKEDEFTSIVDRLYPQGLSDTPNPPLNYILNIVGLS